MTSLIPFKSPNGLRVYGLLIDIYLNDMLRNNQHDGLFNYQYPEQLLFFVLD